LRERISAIVSSSLPKERMVDELITLANVIAQSRLTEQSRDAAKRMETLAAMALAVSTESYPDGILKAISELAAGALDATLCSLVLVDEERRQLVIRAARCSSPEYLQRMPMTIEDSLIGRVVREARPLYVRNVLAEQQCRYPELALSSGLTSLLSVPLMIRQTVSGTLNIYTREERVFSEEEVGFAEAIAGQAAIVIENVRLMGETREMKRALEARKLVERAKGILQQRFNLSEEDAYLRLRNESRRLRRSMRELAEALILAEDLNRKSEPQDCGAAS
jgi:GAF domain-containing protein